MTTREAKVFVRKIKYASFTDAVTILKTLDPVRYPVEKAIYDWRPKLKA